MSEASGQLASKKKSKKRRKGKGNKSNVGSDGATDDHHSRMPKVLLLKLKVPLIMVKRLL